MREETDYASVKNKANSCRADGGDSPPYTMAEDLSC
jgi:hypothetical protein